MPQASFNLKEPSSSTPTLVYLIFNFDNKKLKYSTSQKINPKFWNPEKQRAKETRSFPEHANFNFLLNKLDSSVNDAYRSLLIEGKDPTPDSIRLLLDEAMNKRAGSKEFIPFASSVLEASDRKAVTKRAVQQTINVLGEYQAEIKKCIYFDGIDLDFYNGFIDFLTRRNLMLSTIGSHIKNLKLFMREAFERGLTTNTQFQSKRFRKPGEDSESIYLTQDEIARLNTLDLSENRRLEKVRDLFVVACYTGLRYSDLTQLQIESVSRDKKVLKIKTQKTAEVVMIPVNRTVGLIIDKYNGQLPTAISNHNMNDYLKEIGILAGLDDSITRVMTKGGKRIRQVFKKYELITVHTARRSFATNAFLLNVPSISIMKITGHKTEKNFLKYIKISQEENAKKLVEHPFFA